MCGGAQFNDEGQTFKTFFPNPKPRLPVLTRTGTAVLVPRGRRENQTGHTCQGGRARLESIQGGP